MYIFLILDLAFMVKPLLLAHPKLHVFTIQCKAKHLPYIILQDGNE